MRNTSMYPMRMVVVAFITVLLVNRFVLAAPELKDSEAKAVIEKAWNSGATSIKLGTFEVLDDMFADSNNLNKGVMTVKN